MKILLLGAAGFIGTNLTIELAKKTEDEITLVDRSKAFFKPIVSMPRTEYSLQGNWKPCAAPAVWRFCMHWGISMSTGTKPTITS